MFSILSGIHILFSLLFVPTTQGLKEFRISGYAQGTTYTITYYSSDTIDKSYIQKIFSYLDSSFSLYRERSAVLDFNQHPRGVLVDAGFRKLVDKALYFSRLTCGAFDITSRPLSLLWGFGRNEKMPPPGRKGLDEALKWVGYDKVYLKGDSLLKRHKKTQIDLDGIAQGYSVDSIAFRLEELGVGIFMVELGGEVHAKGIKPDGSTWKIALDNGYKYIDNQISKKILNIKDLAVTTSGSFSKYIQHGKKYFSHIIDPRTGYPVDNGVISVTVIAKDATTADALDNALMVMGVREGLKFLENKSGCEALYIYKKENGSIGDTSTPGFSRYCTSGQ